MKVFWIVVAVLIVAGVALLVSGRDPGPAAPPAPIVDAAPISRPASDAKAAPAPVPPPAPPGVAQSASLAAPIAPGSFETKIEVMNAPSPAPSPSSPPLAPPARETPSASMDAAPPAPPGPQAATQSKQLSPAFDATPPKPTAVEKRDDGSSLLDGRFAISGDGSQEKPYTISWALLVSAQETYKPKQGKTVLPERIKMLDDKYVRITGYIAFPFMAQQATEMLSMQNQWDGCCIGVPPTPYDAIEVTLRRPTVGDERLMQFGVVEGKLKVEPFLRGEWLISLYSMTDAHMSPEM